MYQLRLFGGASLSGPTGPVTGRAGQRRPLALLALLAVGGETGMSRDKIVAYLWPDTRSKRARHLLSVTLHAVRKALGREAVLSVADDLRLDSDLVDVDVQDFEAAVDAGELERAVELYEGPFLDGFHVGGAPEFERWLDRQQAEYTRSYRRALESLAERAEDRGEWWEAVARWKERAAEEPTSSRVTLRLMRALETAGDRPAALQHARIHSELVRQELGVEPDPDVMDLAERLEEGEVSRSERTRPDRAAELPGEDRRRSESPLPLSRGPDSVGSASPGPKATGWTGFRSLRRNAVIVVLGFVLAGVISLWELSGEEAPAGPTDLSAARVAVFPFAVEGRRDLAHLERGIPELLARALDGAGRLAALDLESVLPRSGAIDGGAAGDESGVDLARSLPADLYVEGSVVGTGRDLRVAATVRDPREPGDVLLRSTVDGSPEEILRAVDRLATDLILKLHPGPAHRLTRAAARTTDSLRALKAYMRADRALRRDGSYSALEPLREAVTIDSAFALGHYRLAMAAAAAWRPDLARTSIERAVRLADRLDVREEGLIRAYRAYLVGDADEAVRRYRDLLDGDVLNVEAWIMLGKTLQTYNPLRGRSIHEASEPFRRALEVDSADVRANLGLASLQLTDGRAAGWDSLVRRAFGPDRYTRWRKFSNAAIYHLGTREELDARIRRIAGYPSEVVDRNVRSFSLLPDLAPARRVARLLMEERNPEEWRAVGHRRLADLAFAEGRPAEARSALAGAAALDGRRALEGRIVLATLPHATPGAAELRSLRDSLWIWTPSHHIPSDPKLDVPVLDGELAPYLRPYLLGLINVAMGDVGTALARANELETMEGPSGLATLPNDLALGLRSEVHRDQGRLEAALETLERMELVVPRHRLIRSPFHGLVRERYLRGELLYRLGRPEEALPWLEGVSDDPMGLLYRTPAEVRVAEIHEELGDQQRASLAYERAEKLLSDCEPEVRPLLARVRAGLERLAGEGAGNEVEGGG